MSTPEQVALQREIVKEHERRKQKQRRSLNLRGPEKLEKIAQLEEELNRFIFLKKIEENKESLETVIESSDKDALSRKSTLTVSSKKSLSESNSASDAPLGKKPSNKKSEIQTKKKTGFFDNLEKTLSKVKVEQRASVIVDENSNQNGKQEETKQGSDAEPQKRSSLPIDNTGLAMATGEAASPEGQKPVAEETEVKKQLIGLTTGSHNKALALFLNSVATVETVTDPNSAPEPVETVVEVKEVPPPVVKEKKLLNPPSAYLKGSSERSLSKLVATTKSFKIVEGTFDDENDLDDFEPPVRSEGMMKKPAKSESPSGVIPKEDGVKSKSAWKAPKKSKKEEWEALDPSLTAPFWDSYETFKGKYHSGFAIKGWRDSMEDSVDIHSTSNVEVPNLFGVFDGHGGDECSLFCKNYLLKRVAAHTDLKIDPKSAIADTFVSIDDRYNSLPHHRDSMAGSTATIVYVTVVDLNEAERKAKRSGRFHATSADNPKFAIEAADGEATVKSKLTIKGPKKPKIAYKFFCASVGDSRAVLVYENGRVVPLSVDHNLKRKDELERVRNDHGEVRYDAEFNELLVYSPEAQRGLHLTRTIGDKDFKPFVTPFPEFKEGFLRGDAAFLLLASDGIWEYVKNEEAGKILLDYGMDQGIKNLAELANCRGCADNCSIVAVDVQKMIASLEIEKEV